jgi:hypothetical protein
VRNLVGIVLGVSLGLTVIAAPSDALQAEALAQFKASLRPSLIACGGTGEYVASPVFESKKGRIITLTAKHYCDNYTAQTSRSVFLPTIGASTDIRQEVGLLRAIDGGYSLTPDGLEQYVSNTMTSHPYAEFSDCARWMR